MKSNVGPVAIIAAIVAIVLILAWGVFTVTRPTPTPQLGKAANMPTTAPPPMAPLSPAYHGPMPVAGGTPGGPSASIANGTAPKGYQPGRE